MKTAFSKCLGRAPRVALALLILLVGGGARSDATASEDDCAPLLVFAAASLAPVLEAATGYLERETGADVRVSYAASAVLARQIASGAPADIFISADRRWIDWLQREDNLKDAESYDVARNQLVVALGAGLMSASRDPAVILSQAKAVATADPEIAPLGRYADEAIESLGLSGTLEGRLLWAQDARSALALVETGAADVGILYASDAAGSDRIMRMVPIPEDRHTPIVYVALRLTAGRPAAGALMLALLGDGMKEIIRQNGLLPLGAP